MKIRTLLLIGLSLSVLIMQACQTKSQPEIINLFDPNNNAEGFGGDVRLSVTQKTKVNEVVVYDLKANYRGKLVGFQIVVPENTNQSKEGFGKGIEIKSMGKISDDFRNALAEIYKIKTDQEKKFIDKIPVAFVDLDAFAKSVVKNAKLDGSDFKKLKLFFESKDGEEAELFFNINKDQTQVELAEKDEEYRPLLINFFTKS
ncbi:hypothetical protein AAFN85_07180 [Mucilaginibacter sp. CAU 1740]|uniref:hypothetical protein n=1 Tax=Mucilaginibacter sp. CAU 1740 TaxID=3140365 RepID=UPI00325A8A16